MRTFLAIVIVVVVGSAAAGGCPPPPTETRFTNSYVTGYTWWDNNPPGSAEVCCPVIHQQAGGSGTFADPITVAVDYAGSTGTTMQFAPGTKFYIPNLRAYFIVEDRTGEHQADNTNQHNGSNPHLDVWADGRTSTASNADTCVRSFTNTGLLTIENPASNYRVIVGPLAHDNTCRQNYGNAVLTA